MEASFRETSVDLLENLLGRIEACVGRLTDEQVWWRPNPAVNSIGNLLLHLQGNLSQWVLSGLGGVSFERHRSREFAADRAAKKEDLLEGLRHVVADSATVIRDLGAAELVQPRHIQGYDVDGVYAILHVVEHLSYHTGQIVHVTKELLGPGAQIEFFPQHRGE